MSRIANNPVALPSGVEVSLSPSEISIKGGKGSLTMQVHNLVEVAQGDNGLTFGTKSGDRRATALAGTTRSLVNNMVIGVSEGFTRELQLQGVGYRAQVSGRQLNLTLGFSHPVEYPIPEGIEIETPQPTQIVVKGIDKQLVGQVSADIRAFRPPEPYKGKGVRYADEYVKRKEAKKK
tara:strand:- start:525 stop:1058 length:534 start_codon:yes stop_codon:yes gene_type:complete